MINRELAKKAISNGGSAVSLASGGQKKQKYYTPWGEVVYKAPSIREWVMKDSDGKITDSGTRDANYDNGLLFDRMPEDLKFKCTACKAGHDTQEECDAHAEKTEAFIKKFDKIPEDDKVDILEAKVERLTGMFEQLLDRLGGGETNGAVVQREQDRPEEDRNRKAKAKGKVGGRDKRTKGEI